ncbi:formylmethanofuran dehydrogenase subunit E family protein [Cuniculiplasma sp. SKW3]|uniref:formylmethanofuran dehydrogenase subunit E family protein n=1 Tax=Cuniculiplasma sp. SKW3 TaxID=3400170 RepID=UPI003FD4CF1F
MTDRSIFEKAVLSSGNLPVFFLRDTESSHGRYSMKVREIHAEDILKFHGHACDGLFRGIYAISVAMKKLYPEGIIDRTDTRIISRNSPCIGDVASYITGGRVRFGTQDVISEPGVWYIAQRISDGKAVRVAERKGFFPEEISNIEREFGISKPENIPSLVDLLQKMQDEWVQNVLLNTRPEDNYSAEFLSIDWKEVPYEHKGIRTDILYKNAERVEKDE